MTHQEISEALFEGAVRLDRVIYLAGALAELDSLPSDLSDFLNFETAEDIQKVIAGFPSELLGDNNADLELPAEWLVTHGRLGFLVHVVTPVMKPITKSARSYLWGYCRTQWLYGETMESIVEQALAWAATCRESEDAKATGGAA